MATIVDRRAFIRGMVCAALAAPLVVVHGRCARAQAPSQQPETGERVSFRWRVPSAHYETVQSALRFDGTVENERDSKGLPLVMIFVGVALLPSLVDAILTLRRKLVQPGLKIDTRGPEIKIDVDSNLPRGTILIVDGAGAKLYEPDQFSDPAKLAEALLAAKGK